MHPSLTKAMQPLLCGSVDDEVPEVLFFLRDVLGLYSRNKSLSITEEFFGSLRTMLERHSILECAPLAVIRIGWREACDYVRRFDEISHILGVDPCNLKDCVRFLRYGLLGELAQQCKSAVTHLQAKWVRPSPHEMASDYSLDPGCLGTAFFPHSLRVQLQRDYSFANRTRKDACYRLQTCIMGLKKGLLPLRFMAVGDSLIKHAMTLSRTFKVSPTRLSRMKECAAAILSAGDCVKTRVAEERALDVSTKSTIEYPFARKGNAGYLRDRCSLRASTVYHHEFLGFSCPAQPWKAKPVFGPWWDEDEQCEYAASIREPLTRSLVEPYPILEPLKVRVITKPQAGQYLGLDALQTSGHRELFRNPSGAFVPVGESFNQERLSAVLRAWRSGRAFTSGDYSQATDLLPSSVSEALHSLLYEAASKRSELNSLAFLRSKTMLTQSQIQYTSSFFDTAILTFSLRYLSEDDEASGTLNPSFDLDAAATCHAARLYAFETLCKKLSEAGRKYTWTNCPQRGWTVTIDQTNGQLMGDPASFPILCLWNAANFFDCWLAQRDSQRSNPTQPTPALWLECCRDTGLLICGDDILFCSDSLLNKAWERRVSEYGMVLSPGKNFRSDTFLQFCSETYVVSTQRIFLPPIQIGFEPPLQLWDYCISAVRKAGYFNLGWATSRKKQDCSRDITVIGATIGIDDPVLQRATALTSMWDSLSADVMASDQNWQALHDHMQKAWLPFIKRFPKLHWRGLFVEPGDQGGADRDLFSRQASFVFADVGPTKDWMDTRTFAARLRDPEYSPYQRYKRAVSTSFVRDAQERFACKSTWTRRLAEEARLDAVLG